MSDSAKPNQENEVSELGALKAILEQHTQNDFDLSPTQDEINESLNFEPLEDLDDLEYDLPHVEFTPTLEEILDADNNLYEYNDDFDDDLNKPDYLNSSNQSCSLLENLSIGSGDSRSRDSRSRALRNKKRGDGPREETHGAIMRHVILKGISSQISSASERIDAGLATVMASSPIFIVVGTSHGFIFVFEGNQVMKWSLGNRRLGHEYGSVSSISINQESTFLLAGHAKGHILLYDLTNGKLIKTLSDIHQIGTSITHVKFTNDSNIALISDSGGSVFEINFSRTIGIRNYNSKCIFSGSRGEVCTVEPLLLAHDSEHNFGRKIIVALATISKVIVLSLKSSVKVIFSYPLPGPVDTLPLLAWQFVVIQTTNLGKVVDPVLAFGRHNVIHFYQLSENLSKKPVFVPLHQLDLNYQILNFGWLNSRCMAILDTSEVFHLYDAKNQEELESIDMADIRIVYGSSFFKGLATGGNVSKAMMIAGERATYGSTATYTNQMLILGRQSFHVLVIRSWNDRLDHMIKDNRYIDALNLGCEFYQNQNKALVGLHGTKERRKASIGQKVLAILLKYLDISMTKNFPAEGNVHILSDYFREIVPPCVSTAMNLKRKDILFNNAWDAFNVDPFAKACFLESLEPYILSDQLRNIPVNISQEFVNHYAEVTKFEALEACITHIQVTSLDIHQVMSLCGKQQLYDAIIYIYNNGMLDYVTPMEELMTSLINGLSNEEPLSQSKIDLGNKVLVYISGCLAGRAYPYGDIPKDRLASAKYEVYNCLTTLHSKKSLENELSYPYLRALLRFDTQGLLNVISMAFEESDFQTEMGQRRKERLVEMLLEIMIKGKRNDFTPIQIAHLFTFLAWQIAKGDKSLIVDKSLFNQVLSILIEQKDDSYYVERQQALVELLNAGGLEYFQRDYLIEKAKEAKFYRVLEMLYEQTKEYELMLESFLNDDSPRKDQVFSFIQKIIGNDSFDESAKGKVEKSVIKYILELLHINKQKMSTIIYNHMYTYIKLVLSKLENHPEEKYWFLQTIFHLKESGDTFSFNNSSFNDPLTQKETLETYIDLMCVYESNQLCAYLKSKYGDYDIDSVLEICKKNNNLESQAYLLEKSGKILQAFDILKGMLEKQLNDMPADSSTNENDLYWSHIDASVIIIIQLCQGTHPNITNEEYKSMWLSFLDTFMKYQKPSKIDEEEQTSVDKLKDIIKHVVSSTIGYISTREVVDKILNDPIYQKGNFGDVKDFLLEMLSTYKYEEKFYKSSIQLTKDDQHELMRTQKKEAGKGISVNNVKCDLCNNHLALRGGRCVAFHCHHKYHMPCLDKAGCVLISKWGEEKWQCYRCVSTNMENDILTTGEYVLNEANMNLSSNKPLLDENELEKIVHPNLSSAKKHLDTLKRNNFVDLTSPNESPEHQKAQNLHSQIKLKLWPYPEET